MSSVLRQVANNLQGPTKFLQVSGPQYFDSVLDRNMLFPFTYSNGVLDLAFIDNFEVDMITGPDAPQAPNYDSTSVGPLVKNMGGLGMVRTLGPNLVTYITEWMASGNELDDPLPVDAGSLKVHIPAAVLRVQSALDTQLDMDKTWTVTTNPPSSSEYVNGDVTNDYRVTWIFKTPLTVTFTSGGVAQYLSFYTVFSKDTA